MPKKKRSKYSYKQKRAYWIGVGISMERHGDGYKALENSNVKTRKSVISGYEADNYHDAGCRALNGTSKKKC